MDRHGADRLRLRPVGFAARATALLTATVTTSASFRTVSTTGTTVKGEAEVVELRRGQARAALRAAEIKATVPEAHYARRHAHASADAVIAALARALRAHPEANASYRDSRFERFERVNVAVMVTDANGDEVAVTLFDADTMDAAEIAAARAELAARAAAGELTAPDSAGATAAVHDLTGTGVETFTPLLTMLHTVCLGVTDSHLSLTCDARALTARQAAALLDATAEP